MHKVFELFSFPFVLFSYLFENEKKDLECHEAVLKAGEEVVCAVQEESLYLLVNEFASNIKSTTPLPVFFFLFLSFALFFIDWFFFLRRLMGG